VRCCTENLTEIAVLWCREHLTKILAYLEEQGAQNLTEIMAVQIRAFAVRKQVGRSRRRSTTSGARGAQVFAGAARAP
jgi:hypothetical protein